MPARSAVVLFACACALALGCKARRAPRATAAGTVLIRWDATGSDQAYLRGGGTIGARTTIDTAHTARIDGGTRVVELAVRVEVAPITAPDASYVAPITVTATVTDSAGLALGDGGCDAGWLPGPGRPDVAVRGLMIRCRFAAAGRPGAELVVCGDGRVVEAQPGPINERCR